ncbi:MAG TPA: sigma-70 family RNA polymerase sigma factor [Candidatus Sulfotelmatobacter sp.]|nr:sigma-70 family RNA polymerase sigma factor [Candidatus Sulfotelmatobacter sp.]
MDAERLDLGTAFQVHGPLLLAAARAITLNEAEAQDLVQTTFEIALRHAAELRDPDSLRPWLLRVQAREAFRLVRRLRRFVPVGSGVVEVAVPAPDATDSLAVRRALGGLPRRMRAAVVLHHLAGLSVAETATALGVTESTVKSQLKTGLARLREALGDG